MGRKVQSLNTESNSIDRAVSALEWENIDEIDVSELLEKVKQPRIDVPEPSEVDIPSIKPQDTMLVWHHSSKARNEFILKYFSMGITIRSIYEMLKTQQDEMGWTPITENWVRQVVIAHYKKRSMLMRGVDWKDNEKAMKEAALEQQEKFLEKLILLFNKHERNKTFKNLFEQVQLADLIHRMRQQYIENRNWNDSRKNPLVVAESNQFEVNLFESSGQKMLVNGRSDAMANVLQHLRAKFSDNWDAVEAEYTEADEPEEE